MAAQMVAEAVANRGIMQLKQRRKAVLQFDGRISSPLVGAAQRKSANAQGRTPTGLFAPIGAQAEAARLYLCQCASRFRLLDFPASEFPFFWTPTNRTENHDTQVQPSRRHRRACPRLC
jgi:hypothetical protein